MIPHIILAKLCQEIYRQPPTYWDHYFDADDVVFGHRHWGDVDVFTFRGSMTVDDWLRDLNAVPQWDAQLGFVHGGFEEGTLDAFQKIMGVAKSQIVLTGHSLGAARAWIVNARLALVGRAPVQTTVFGSPRPGFSKLSRIIRNGGGDLTSYRNNNDPVTEVPYMLGLFKRPVELTALHGKDHGIEVAKDHFMGEYLHALGA